MSDISNVEGGEIIVTGLRESVAESVRKKRDSTQIVDVVTAEDAGKLPDNNVIGAMSRVTGVTITRARGEATGFTIRGLSGVQTTVNGVETATATSRTLDLSNIPAELVKSIEVYKTRTADQIEGGIGGTVNIQLRRPLDLRKGLTVAGGARGVYREVGSTKSPFLNLLVANRFETGIGEMGLLVNGSISRNQYQEAISGSESPAPVCCGATYPIWVSVPVELRANGAIPYKAYYGQDDGYNLKKSVTTSYQWAPTPNLNFTLEGTYINGKSRNSYTNLYLLGREPYYTLSNINVAPSGVFLGYDIANNYIGRNGLPYNNGNIGTGFGGSTGKNTEQTYLFNFETHWTGEGARIDIGMQYQQSRILSYSNFANGNYPGLKGARVDYNSPQVLNSGPYFVFKGVDISNPSSGGITEVGDNITTAQNKNYAANVDLTKDVSETGLLRNFKFGVRFTRFDNGYGVSSRYARYNTAVPLSRFAGLGIDTQIVSPTIPGTQPVRFAVLNPGQFFDQWTEVEKFLIANTPDFRDGPSRSKTVAEQFATPMPNDDNPNVRGKVRENRVAAYLSLNYGFKALFPIDGNVGVRGVNTFSNIAGTNILLRPALNAAGQPILNQAGGLTYGPTETVFSAVDSNYVDVMPSAFALVHFTDKLQLRASYTYNVQRPSLILMRNYRQVNYVNPNDAVYAGNPDLKPTNTHDYNLALEYYFGKGGIVSVTGFRKSQEGYIYTLSQPGSVPELGGETRIIQQPYNAGPGKTEGIEFQATGFFSFLPGMLKNFGATVNGTWIPTATVSLPYAIAPQVYEFREQRTPFISTWSYNAILYYETPKFGARVAFNRRTRYKTGADANGEYNVQESLPTQRLDAAINWTPIPNITFTLEGANLLRNVDRLIYYRYPELPVGLRAMGREITGGVRFRF